MVVVQELLKTTKIGNEKKTSNRGHTGHNMQERDTILFDEISYDRRQIGRQKLA